MIGSNADGFHSTDVATGPTLSNSHLTNIENDFFSTHSTMHIAVPLPVPNSHNFMLIDPREFAFGTPATASTVDEYYGTASPLNHVRNGTDTVSCFHFNSLAPIGRSVVSALKEITDATFVKNFFAKANPDAPGGINGIAAQLNPKMQSWTSAKLWNVTLPILESKLASFSNGAICTVDRFGGPGAQVVGNHFTNGAALLGRTKSSGAVIRGNTWTDTATHTLEITALQNFMEGPVEIKGVTIDGNTLIRSTDNTTSPVAAGPNATGVTFTNNKIVPRLKTDDHHDLVLVAFMALSSLAHAGLESGPVPLEFSDWKTLYRRVYRSPAEEHHRNRVYAEEAATVKRHNEQAARGLETFTMSVNQWSDLRANEFAELMGLRNNLSAYNSTGDEEATWLPETEDEASVPPQAASLDWRSKGAVTGVKDQGQCGGCVSHFRPLWRFVRACILSVVPLHLVSALARQLDNALVYPCSFVCTLCSGALVRLGRWKVRGSWRAIT